MPDHLDQLQKAYALTKERCQLDSLSDASNGAIKDFALLSLRFLANECAPVALVSKVAGKKYIGFKQKGVSKVISRPANEALFKADPSLVDKKWDAWSSGTLPTAEMAWMSYTVCLAPCLALELFDRQNKKGPATYFECAIGHIFSKTLQVNPDKKMAFKVGGRSAALTMDFLFGKPNGLKVHVAVKMSTRERIVQAWAHQRILDAAYGEASYKGVMVLFGETKLDSRSLEVVEICVPDQWIIYQSLLSRMTRIYYFDLPERYRQLSVALPELIQVKDFSEFFTEREQVLAP